MRSTVGGAALVGAAALAVVAPPNALTIILASVATILLAFDRRLGPLPAAALVALSIPWGRGADTLTYEIAGVPLRPHDAVLLIGIVGALPVLWRRRPTLTPTLVLAAVLLVLGAVAVATGLILGNDIRDIMRDVRWWMFYGVIVLAAFGGTTRPAIMRGLLIGLFVFTVLVIVAAVLPVFPGGLKDQELAYDRGTLRMQFGNSAFLLVAIGYSLVTLLRRGTWMSAASLLLLLTAVVLSLTRTSIMAAGIVVVSCLGLYLVEQRGSMPALGSLARTAAAVAAIAASTLVLGVWINIAGTPAGSVVDQNGQGGGSAPVDRLLFQTPESDLGSLEQGRFPSYRAAAALILAHPALGAGMGSLTDVDYAYSAARAHTYKRSPSVDDAYLTVGLKTGVPGIVTLAALMLATLLAGLKLTHRMRTWFVPAWIGICILSVTQAFAVSFYGPFALALLIAYPVLRRGSSHSRRVTQAA